MLHGAPRPAGRHDHGAAGQDGGVHDVVSYGDHEDQVVDVVVPDGDRTGVAVLIHGGYWRAQFTRALMEPLVVDLLARGWVVANVEYRRVGSGGGWPQTVEDARAAVTAVTRLWDSRGWAGPVVSIGHSVGGQLALLSAEAVDAVVALAPVTDLARTRAEGLGDGAVAEFIAESPERHPESYAEGSPIAQLPLGRPVLVVHGDADTRVPLAHSTAFVDQAHRAGDRVALTVLEGVDHLQLIDPDQQHWAGVVDFLASVEPGSRP